MRWRTSMPPPATRRCVRGSSGTRARSWQRKAREDVRAFPAVAYVAAITGNAAMRDAARARADRLDLGSWGKPYSINGRIGFRIESLLAAAPPHPPPARHK